MKLAIPAQHQSSRIVSAWRRLRRTDRSSLRASVPLCMVSPEKIRVLSDPVDFRETLLKLISQAKSRILIAALYLQDDDGGREILAALYAAKKRSPQIDISVFVDWHRAQRGLIGKTKSEGNAALYKAMAREHEEQIGIYGVPVQRSELLGVMHLKGFVIDDTVLFSGASLNDVYLKKHNRYRIDRYHVIESKPLAESMADFLTTQLRAHPATISLSQPNIPKTATIRQAIAHLRREMAGASYEARPEGNEKPVSEATDTIGLMPLIGLGARKNMLNSAILQMIGEAQKNIVLFTPYFNLPRPVRKAFDMALKRGCKITIILGDKTANDFYIRPEEPFKAIGTLPYLYEVNLRRFCIKRQPAINAGQLNIHLWKHDDNSFHLKGLLVDEEYALLTGHNINPRAWRLDLENGIIIHDPQHQLIDQHLAELDRLLVHTKHLTHFAELDDISTYPQAVQRLLKRLSRVSADRLINQVL